jgi:hypothetical protein
MLAATASGSGVESESVDIVAARRMRAALMEAIAPRICSPAIAIRNRGGIDEAT